MLENFGFRLLTGAVTLTVMFLYAAGYFSASTQVFNVPLAEAHDTLARTPLPPIVLGSSNGDDIPRFTSKFPTTIKIDLLPPPSRDHAAHGFKIDASNPKRIVWTFLKDGAEALFFIATLEPAGDGSTRIAVDLTGPSSGRYGDMAKKIGANRTIRNLYVTAMKEQIAAVLEHRDFNLTGIYPAMLAATAANAPRLMDRINRGIAADQKRIEDNIARAYEREAAGKH
jgi:hypothetical protein